MSHPTSRNGPSGNAVRADFVAAHTAKPAIAAAVNPTPSATITACQLTQAVYNAITDINAASPSPNSSGAANPNPTPAAATAAAAATPRHSPPADSPPTITAIANPATPASPTGTVTAKGRRHTRTSIQVNAGIAEANTINTGHAACPRAACATAAAKTAAARMHAAVADQDSRRTAPSARNTRAVVGSHTTAPAAPATAAAASSMPPEANPLPQPHELNAQNTRTDVPRGPTVLSRRPGAHRRSHSGLGVCPARSPAVVHIAPRLDGDVGKTDTMNRHESQSPARRSRRDQALLRASEDLDSACETGDELGRLGVPLSVWPVRPQRGPLVAALTAQLSRPGDLVVLTRADGWAQALSAGRRAIVLCDRADLADAEAALGAAEAARRALGRICVTSPQHLPTRLGGYAGTVDLLVADADTCRSEGWWHAAAHSLRPGACLAVIADTADVTVHARLHADAAATRLRYVQHVVVAAPQALDDAVDAEPALPQRSSAARIHRRAHIDVFVYVKTTDGVEAADAR